MDKQSMDKHFHKIAARREAIAFNNRVPFNARFKTLGDFAQRAAFATLSKNGDPTNLLSDFLDAAASAGVGADGGFAVPPQFATEIREKVCTSSLLGLADYDETPGNSLTSVTDADEPWDQDNGIKVSWDAEGGQLTASAPHLEAHTAKLAKMTALVPVTRELLEDAPSLDSYLRRKVSEKMGAAINTVILSGNGVGRPLGIMNSPALITVDKVTDQTADTLVAANISAMASRWHSEPRNGHWLCNKVAEGALVSAAAGAGFYGPGHRVMDLPIVPLQACQVLGDLGDIVLADLTQYHLVGAMGGLSVIVSPHLWFDHDLVTFKFVWRLQGQPWPSATITPQHGADALSPFVALAERA